MRIGRTGDGALLKCLVVFCALVVVAIALVEPALSQEGITAPGTSPSCEPPPEQDPPPVVVGFPLPDAEKELFGWDPTVDIARVPDPADEVDVTLVIVRAQSDVVWICSEPGFDDGSSPAHPTITLDLGTVVPDVVGEPLAEARDLLRAHGLLPVGAGDADADRVVDAQDPRAGETVDLGTTVRLRVPGGGGGATSPARVAVPSIVGLTPKAARRAVRGAGLVFRRVREGEGPEVGRVIAQDPPARTLVPRGTQVTATIEMVSAGLGTPTAAEELASAWLPILAGVAIGIALTILMSSFLRARYRRRWTRGRIALEPRPDVGRVTLSEDVGGGRSFSFGLRSRVAATWSELEEDEEVWT